MDKLAMLGGTRVVPRGQRLHQWPIVTEDEEQAVARVLASGRFTSAAAGEQEVLGLEREWADYVGTAHAIAVDNGTTALALALAAAGVRPADEVIVPALSFIASAMAPVHVGARPVFVDIDPASFNATAATIEPAITERTRAIVVVHLHGLPVDLAEIRELADRHGLLMIEDAAQAHGASYRDRQVGSFGVINSFSLNVSKNLPTCGEGGLLNTDDDRLHQRARMLRQFGEAIASKGERSYLSHLMGWNYKPNAIQCAFTRSQLARFDTAAKARNANVDQLLGRLAGLPGLPGLQVPSCPADRTHAWHILRFRVDAAAFGLPAARSGALRSVLMRALRAEGVAVSQYQLMPLPMQRVFGGLAEAERFPVACQVIDDSFTIQKAHLHPEAGPLLGRYAEAFEKVWQHRDELAGFAAAADDEPPWVAASRLADAEAAALPF